MGKKVLNYISLCLLFLCSVGVQGQEMTVAERNAAQGFNDTIDRLAPDFVTVKLVIADPGAVLYTVLGHACLRLQCPAYDMDYVFSYESESVEGKLGYFLTNKLKMGMALIDPTDFLQPYIEEGRGVREYTLNLPPEVKMELWRMCDERAAQGMNLEYDPVKRGCAISVVHCVEDAVKSANSQFGTQYNIGYPEWGIPFKRTLREIFYDYAPHGWGLFWCMTLVGGVVDKPHLPNKEKLISPQQLTETWQQCSIEGHPLIDRPADICCEGIGVPAEAFTPIHAALIVLLLALLGFLWKQPYLDWLVLAVQTLFGCLILWVLVMPLPATGWTWLIVPFNPFPLIAWHWRRYWALPYAGVILVWCFVMVGEYFWGHILVDWSHIILALAFCVVLVKNSRHCKVWKSVRRTEGE